jgi:hypothetical protein
LNPASEGASETIQTSPDVLRVVIDANITLAIFLARRDQPSVVSSKRALLDLLVPTENPIQPSDACTYKN